MVEQQILGQLSFMLRNRSKSLNLFGIHNRQIKPGFRAVIKKNRIHYFARTGRQSKADVADSQHSSHVRQLLLNEPNALNRLYRAADVIFVSRCTWKYQRIENERKV